MLNESGKLGDHFDAVVLDVGGVLLVPHPESIATALVPLGIEIDRALIERAHYTGVGALDACQIGVDQIHRCYLAAFAGAFGVAASHLDTATDLLAALWADRERGGWSWHVPGSREALRALVDDGHTVAILSNSNGTVEALLRELAVCQVGEGEGAPVRLIVDSHVLGIAKPDPRIFHHVAEAIGVPPERCLYVGDTVRYDVLGARAAGFHPYHFDPHGLCASQDVHPHLRSLDEIADIVGARSALDSST
jgi:putative hydrolase of the HAD superfamily